MRTTKANISLIKIFLILGITISILFNFDVTLLFKSINFKMLMSILKVQVFIIMSMVFSSVRYSLLINNRVLKIKYIFKAIVLSSGLNFFLPVRMSEFFRPLYLNKGLGISISSSISALFLEHVIDLIILGMLSLFGISMILIHIDTNTYFTLTFVLLLFVVLFPYFERLLLSIVSRIKIKFITEFIKRCIIHIAKCIREGTFYKAFSIGILSWGLSFAMVFSFIKLVGSIQLDLKGSLFVFIAVMVGGAIPVFPGGLGTYEGAAVFALKTFGYGTDEALVLAIGLHISQMFFVMVSAIIIIITEHINLHDWINHIKLIIIQR